MNEGIKEFNNAVEKRDIKVDELCENMEYCRNHWIGEYDGTLLGFVVLLRRGVGKNDENTRIAVVIVKNLKDRVRTIEGDFYTGREKDEILNSMIQTFTR
ncbi:Protein CBG15830 [Caenorhabditis briggsae]|uniref:Protein CBG15830 n=1 Tax=Caenorhabditis briggsae TaxID=6238 RepID=A8XMX8_CAEBR|nr:Protein CBG15830 [Caenorhabditis briggsae]CAP34003.2 Protein CBG15830 [Caenorhabditis briggsae]